MIGGYQALLPRWLERLAFYWLFPSVVWIMQARMLAVLKRNIEYSAMSGARAVAASRAPTAPTEVVALRGL